MTSRALHRSAALAVLLVAGLDRMGAWAGAPERRWCGTGAAAIEEPKATPGQHIVVPPRPKSTNAVPRLPKGSKGGADATVVINAHVNRHGDVDAIDVQAGAEPLVSEVVKAVCRWKYEPATLDGSPFPVWKAIRIEPPPSRP